MLLAQQSQRSHRDLGINPRFPCLFFLILPVNVIDPVPALEKTSGLMEVERYSVFDALHLGDDDPAIVTESGTFSGFPAAGDAFDLIMILIEVFLDMNFLQHRLVDNFFVAYREL